MAEANSIWPFDEPTNLATFTTTKVIHENYPILLVTHDEHDGGWQFLCGTTNASKDALIVALNSIYKRDPSVGELSDLPMGWQASRESPMSPWQREPNVYEADDE